MNDILRTRFGSINEVCNAIKLKGGEWEMKTTIYWVTKDAESIQRIREKFNLSPETTVNGETPAEIREEDFPLLKETEKRGFIQVRNK